jgi:hypothetical protein
MALDGFLLGILKMPMALDGFYRAFWQLSGWSQVGLGEARWSAAHQRARAAAGSEVQVVEPGHWRLERVVRLASSNLQAALAVLAVQAAALAALAARWLRWMVAADWAAAEVHKPRGPG